VQFFAAILLDLFFLDVVGIAVCIVALVALALEGGYKHFADNLNVLQSHNDEYQLMLDQQREQNQRLQGQLEQFSGNLRDMTDQNSSLRGNVSQLEVTQKAMTAQNTEL